MNEYFYIGNNDKQVGPFSVDELKFQPITPQTPVWCEGMADWTPAGNVEELKPLFRQENNPPHWQQPPYGNYYNQPNYGQQPPYGSGCQNQTPEIKPDNWLVWSILCTVLCCLPFGIAGIVYSAQVDSNWNQGRHEEAYRCAKKAKLFTLIGIISSAAGYVLYVGFIIVMILLGNASHGIFFQY